MPASFEAQTKLLLYSAALQDHQTKPEGGSGVAWFYVMALIPEGPICNTAIATTTAEGFMRRPPRHMYHTALVGATCVCAGPAAYMRSPLTCGTITVRV